MCPQIQHPRLAEVQLAMNCCLIYVIACSYRWDVQQSVGLWPLNCWDFGFECRQRACCTRCVLSARLQLKCDGTRWRREGKWRGNGRMEWVASTLHTTSERGVSSITTADAHTSAASSRLNWRLRADLNGLVRFAERRNLVSAHVPSYFNWPLQVTAASR